MSALFPDEDDSPLDSDMSSWSEMMKGALTPGEKIVYCTLTRDEMDESFDASRGSPHGKIFLAWSERSVFFPVCVEGGESIQSAPRNPRQAGMPHLGDGDETDADPPVVNFVAAGVATEDRPDDPAYAPLPLVRPPGTGIGLGVADGLARLELDVDAKAKKSNRDLAYLEECWATMHRRMEILERSVWRKPKWRTSW